MFSGIWDPLKIDWRPPDGHPYEIRVYALHEFLGPSRAVTLAVPPLQAIAYFRDDQEVTSILQNVHTNPLLLYLSVTYNAYSFW